MRFTPRANRAFLGHAFRYLTAEAGIGASSSTSAPAFPRRPSWLTGSDKVLAMLLDTVPWEHRERWMYTRMVAEPRLTAEYADLAAAPQPLLKSIGAALSARYGVAYDRLWMNLYRDNDDGTGWHADRPARKLPEAIIPVLSVGATRRFLIRPNAGGQSTVFTPASGDLIVMGGTCQRGWQHCVPKQKAPAGQRSSLNFSARIPE